MVHRESVLHVDRVEDEALLRLLDAMSLLDPALEVGRLVEARDLHTKLEAEVLAIVGHRDVDGDVRGFLRLRYFQKRANTSTNRKKQNT